jgi:hypothetical protein
MNLTIVCAMNIVPRLESQSTRVLGPKTNNTMNQLQQRAMAGVKTHSQDFNSKSYNWTKRVGFLAKETH